MLIMTLAFLVDQTQQMCCPAFRASWKKLGSKRHLWEMMRSRFKEFVFDSMAELLTSLVRGIVQQKPVLRNSS